MELGKLYYVWIFNVIKILNMLMKSFNKIMWSVFNNDKLYHLTNIPWELTNNFEFACNFVKQNNYSQYQNLFISKYEYYLKCIQYYK